MASIDESGARYAAGQPEQTAKAVEQNMLDGLKQELGLNEVGNPQNDNSFIKQKKLYEENRATVVYDENEEDYDSEAEEGEDLEAREKRRSFKKNRSSLGAASPMAA